LHAAVNLQFVHGELYMPIKVAKDHFGKSVPRWKWRGNACILRHDWLDLLHAEDDLSCVF